MTRAARGRYARVMAVRGHRRSAGRGLERPVHEDALYFGIQHPDVQRDGPIVFLHEPWFGYFGRWDVIRLWENAGRREIGLGGFDDPWSPEHRFAFVQPGGSR